jgi:hypothetical protein
MIQVQRRPYGEFYGDDESACDGSYVYENASSSGMNRVWISLPFLYISLIK